MFEETMNLKNEQPPEGEQFTPENETRLRELQKMQSGGSQWDIEIEGKELLELQEKKANAENLKKPSRGEQFTPENEARLRELQKMQLGEGQWDPEIEGKELLELQIRAENNNQKL